MIEKVDWFRKVHDSSGTDVIFRYTEVDSNGETIPEGKIRFEGKSFADINVTGPDGRPVGIKDKAIQFEIQAGSLKVAFKTFEREKKKRIAELENQATALVRSNLDGLITPKKSSSIIVPGG